MTSRLRAMRIAAADPARLAEFWSGLLGWPQAGDGADRVEPPPTDDTAFGLRFVRDAAPKLVANQMHLDLTSSSLQDQQATVDLALDLGAHHIQIGQRPEEGHVVLADPEGNELCVIEPDNSFLADCGFVGALACDGSQTVGYFWSRALDWPLVWDQGEETAIRAPHGGPKLTWGGPPLAPRATRNRLALDLEAAPGADLEAEVARLVGLGAHRVDRPASAVGGVTMTDPDGNDFTLSTATA